MGDVSGVVDTRIQPGATLLHVFVLIYLKNKIGILELLCIYRKMKKGAHSLYAPHPVFPNVDLLRYCGTHGKTKEST